MRICSNSMYTIQTSPTDVISYYFYKSKLELHKSFEKTKLRNRENIPAIKDCNGLIITDSVEKANSLNF